jgi:hypothetical protein
MIDRRTKKEEGCEIEKGLANISDTQILLNFQRAITSLYPHLIPIRAHCYDPWDDLSESLFYQMVYMTFEDKYGVPISSKEHHKYGFTNHCYRKIHHIECLPKQEVIPMICNEKQVSLSKEDLSGRVLVFREFGDLNYWLSGEVDPSEALNVKFDHTAVDIVSLKSGFRFRDLSENSYFIPNDHLDFTFVAETYDPAEHEFYREVFEDAK